MGKFIVCQGDISNSFIVTFDSMLSSVEVITSIFYNKKIQISAKYKTVAKSFYLRNQFKS